MEHRVAQLPVMTVTVRTFGVSTGVLVGRVLACLGVDPEICFRVALACMFVRVKAAGSVSWHRFKLAHD